MGNEGMGNWNRDIRSGVDSIWESGHPSKIYSGVMVDFLKETKACVASYICPATCATLSS